MNNKYENGKIYKITDISYTLTYYGSTIETLSQRMGRHRSYYRTYKNKGDGVNISVFKIFDEFGLENCKIELVELCPCASKMELERKEGEYIKNNECVNKMIMGRTAEECKKEYRKKHKDILSQKNKEYYILKKDIILQRNKDHYILNKDVVSQRQKEYYSLNKDVVSQRRKEYYSLNREILSKKHKEYYILNKDNKTPSICNLCGGRYQRNSESKHYLTKKHQNALSSTTHEPEEELNPEDDNTNDKTP